MMSKLRHVRWLLLICLFLGVTVWAGTAVARPTAAPNAPTGGGPALNVALVADGFTQPVDIASAGDDRLFVVERSGVIKVINVDGTVLSEPFLDINTIVDHETHGERGLLGLAFHPNYPDTPYFYVNYTAVVGNDDTTIIARYAVSSNPYVADADSETILLVVDQPDPNHNAGDLNFGPDGYLYVGFGDGGSGNDSGQGHNPEIGNAQDMTTLLGKMLRLNVDGDSGLAPDCGQGEGGATPPYTIPVDNPFVAGGDGICNEIWASGLRNPWRYSFDRDTGDLYIGDVGQGAWEEVNFQPASSSGGENYGWRCYEGNSFTGLDSMVECDADYVFPFDDYPHASANPDDRGSAVTGGFVYRGSQYPALQGYYVYADYGSSNVWLALPDGGGGWTITPLGEIGVQNPSSFGEGCGGELYVASFSGGGVYQVGTSSSSIARPLGEPGYLVYLPIIQSTNTLTCTE